MQWLVFVFNHKSLYHVVSSGAAMPTILSLPIIIAFSLCQEAQDPQMPPKYELIPAKDGGLPLDSKDCLAVIIGPATAKAILDHRPEFRSEYEKVQIAPDLIARWQAVETPCTFVAVFGSWCGDSHHWAPDLIKLSETPNPFVTIHWIST
jgi:hypothetical protein